MTAKQKKCLFPECVHVEHCRGLCHGHYESARRYVAKGSVTWAELEKHGKCMPAKRRGQKSTTRLWFTDFEHKES